MARRRDEAAAAQSDGRPVSLVASQVFFPAFVMRLPTARRLPEVLSVRRWGRVVLSGARSEPQQTPAITAAPIHAAGSAQDSAAGLAAAGGRRGIALALSMSAAMRQTPSPPRRSTRTNLPKSGWPAWAPKPPMT